MGSYLLRHCAPSPFLCAAQTLLQRAAAARGAAAMQRKRSVLDKQQEQNVIATMLARQRHPGYVIAAKALSAFPDPISCDSGVYTYIRMHAKIQAAIRERK